MTSPFFASGSVKSASCALDGTSGAFCQLKCFSTVHVPPTLPALCSCAPTPVRRSRPAMAPARLARCNPGARCCSRSQTRSTRADDGHRTGARPPTKIVPDNKSGLYQRALRRNVGHVECRGGASGAVSARGAAELRRSRRRVCAAAVPDCAFRPTRRRRAAPAHCVAACCPGNVRRRGARLHPQCANARTPRRSRSRKQRRWRAAVTLAACFQVCHHAHQRHQPRTGDSGARVLRPPPRSAAAAPWPP